MMFVGRDTELARLNELLRKMLNYETQVCFISGEAGTGKSSLIAEFVRQSEQLEQNLVFTIGQCNDQFGICDPYLPFRNILGMLTGDDAKAITPQNSQRLRSILKRSGRALIEIAPDLVGSLIPGGSILLALARMEAKERGFLKGLEERAIASKTTPNDIESSQIFLQSTALFRNLSQEYPLVIILDDLQWVDAASNALFFHLARELRECRVLLVGLYRPNDLAIERNNQRHPFKTTFNDIKRIYGDIRIDLDRITQQNGQKFVENFVNSQPNNLSLKFLKTLFQWTGGNALFTTELWKSMQQRGDLIQTNGLWEESPNLDWEQLPDKIEAIIEERIERLPKNLRELLNIACVEGQDFTAQVIATIKGTQLRNIIEQLSDELEQHHKLVIEGGDLRLGQTMLSRYTFSHSLFHSYLYHKLAPAKRTMHHTEVADALEFLYASQTETIAVQLVRHYREAHNQQKVVAYLQMAGEQAYKVGEFTQARDFFMQALESIGVNETGQTNINRANLLWWIAQTYYHTGLYEPAETEYRKSIETAQKLGDQESRVRGLLGLAQTLRRQRRFEEGLTVVQEALSMARQTRNRMLESQALRVTGIFYGGMDRTHERRSCYEQALEIAVEIGDVVQQMSCLNSLGVLFGEVLGNYDKAREYYNRALELGIQQKRLTGQSTYLINLAFTFRKIGDRKKCEEYIDLSLSLLTKMQNITATSIVYYSLGILKLYLGDINSAIEELEKSVNIADQYKLFTQQVESRNYLILCCLTQNKLDDALRLSEETKPFLAKYREKSKNFTERLLEAIIYLRRGELNQARQLFEVTMVEAIELQPSQYWICRYHRAFAQAGITLLYPVPETRNDYYLPQTRKFFQEAIEICGCVGILDETLLILREMRKADPHDVLKSIEEELIQKHENAWKKRELNDSTIEIGQEGMR